MTTPPATHSANVHNLAPLLYVSDMDRSAAFYDNKLGFDLIQHWEPAGKMLWCLLRRGGADLMLQQADEKDGPAQGRGRGVMFFFGCDDADALHAELVANGLKLDPPQVAFYGMKQLFVKDPDGYELCFQNRVDKV
jgi:catechol 2,3-dioxygenase-like lactoylglutathione lyase family enzyme